ncbi:MAG: DUF29 family protein [Gammaproteobacteria bacterium]|jgi:hypothetical protein|nr:DUF29 family protein [Gammaproteobacteria bacterium]
MPSTQTISDPQPDTALYERDFFAWANEQAALLHAGRFVAADIERIAEEIESLGRGEKREAAGGGGS